MVSAKIVVKKSDGPACAASIRIYALCRGFHARITVAKTGGQPVSAKSMIMVLSQGIVQGTEIEICAVGDDEEAALAALVKLAENFTE